MSATCTKQTYTVVVINKPMSGTDSYRPLIQCFEIDKKLIKKVRK